MMKKSIIAVLLGLSMQAVSAEDLVAVYEIAFDYDAQLRAAGAVRDAQYETKPLARSTLLPQIGVFGDLAYDSLRIRES